MCDHDVSLHFDQTKDFIELSIKKSELSITVTITVSVTVGVHFNVSDMDINHRNGK